MNGGGLPTTQKTGYYLVGWFDKEEDGQKVSNSTTVRENHTLYAYWEVNPYILTFNENYEGGSITTKTIIYGQKYNERRSCWMARKSSKRLLYI